MVNMPLVILTFVTVRIYFTVIPLFIMKFFNTR